MLLKMVSVSLKIKLILNMIVVDQLQEKMEKRTKQVKMRRKRKKIVKMLQI